MRKFISCFLLFLFLALPRVVFAITREEYNNAMVQVGLSTATTYQSDFVYSYRWAGTPENPVDKISLLNGTYLTKAKQGIKIESGYIYGSLKKEAGIQGSFKNKFVVYCGSYVHLMIYHVSGGKITMNDYENIPLNQMKKGDLIHYPNHIAIYLDNGNDNSEYTYNVIEASGKVKTGIARQPIAQNGMRIKDSALAKLDYNLLFASYDYHDRLDDYAPIITGVQEVANTNKIKITATDYKHYDLAEKSDVLEPENNGIVAYQVKKTSSVPTTDWKSVNKTSNLSVTYEVSGNGKYYIFVKDVGGNVTKKEVNLTKIVIDKEKPTLGNFSYDSKKTSIVVTVNNATDNSGIKEYRFYLDNKLAATSSSKSYEIKNLVHNKKYSLYYEVVDIYGNINKSSSFDVYTEVDASSIEIDNTKMNLLIGESQKISPEIVSQYSTYNITYKSSNTSICTVDNNGTVKAVSAGDCYITVSVGNTKKTVSVKVTTVKINYEISELPIAYIDSDYSVLIKTNPQGIISAATTTTLPDGLYIENNYLKGKPTDQAIGTHIIYLRSVYNDATNDKMFLLTINYKLELNDITESKFILEQEAYETINSNYPGSMTIISGKLPKGMYLDNNVLTGIPTEKGNFTFTIEAEYMNSKTEKTYKISVVEDEVVPVEVNDYEKNNDKNEDETPVETEDNVNIKEQEEANGDKVDDNTKTEPLEDKEEEESKVYLVIIIIIVLFVAGTLIIEVLVAKKSSKRRRYR